MEQIKYIKGLLKRVEKIRTDEKMEFGINKCKKLTITKGKYGWNKALKNAKRSNTR